MVMNVLTFIEIQTFSSAVFADLLRRNSATLEIYVKSTDRNNFTPVNILWLELRLFFAILIISK